MYLKRKTKGKGKDKRSSKKATGIVVGDAREVDSELGNVEESAVDSDCESSDLSAALTHHNQKVSSDNERHERCECRGLLSRSLVVDQFNQGFNERGWSFH